MALNVQKKNGILIHEFPKSPYNVGHGSTLPQTPNTPVGLPYLKILATPLSL